MNVEQIAKTCHEVNRAYCFSIGDDSQLPWADASDWQKESAVKGVQFRLDNPESTSEELHESWLKEKEDTGWVYGKVKDPKKKEHPCMVPYEDLPQEQQAKDALFIAVVESFEGNSADLVVAGNIVVYGDVILHNRVAQRTDQV